MVIVYVICSFISSFECHGICLGSLPSAVGSLGLLSDFYFNYNSFSGTHLVQTVAWHLQKCFPIILGSIPSTIGSLTALTLLFGSTNKLTGR